MKKETLENVTLKVLELHTLLSQSEKFTMYPQVIFEGNFVSVGNDIEKKKQTQKFTKRLNVIMKDMDQLHSVRHNILNILSGFKCTYLIIRNDLGYSSLAKQYSQLGKALKEYAKVMKAQKNNPEMLELSEDFKFLETLNVFDLMREDLTAFQPTIQKRVELSKEQYPDFVPRSGSTSEIDWDQVKEDYKKG